MDSEQLRRSLEALRAEVNRADLSEGRVRKRINALITDLEVKLDRPDDEDDDDDSFVERLRDGFEQFKLEHPDATSLINRILVSLGEAGI